MDTTITRVSPLIIRHTTTIDGAIRLVVSVDHLDHDAFRKLGIDLEKRSA